MNIAIITASDLDMSSQYLPHIDSIGAALLTSYDFIKLLSLSVFGHIDFVKTSEVIRDAVQDECLSLSSPSVVFSIIDKVVSDYFIDTNSILFVLYIIFAFLNKSQEKWTLKEFAIICAASLFPFGTFYIDKKYLQPKQA